MTKLVAPLLSMKASGKFGNDTVFSSWNGQAYAKRYAIPTPTNTPEQISLRLMFQFLATAWPHLSPAAKASWHDPAHEKRITACNVFMSYNLDRWTRFLCPQQSYRQTVSSSQTTVYSHGETGAPGSIHAWVQSRDQFSHWQTMLFISTVANADPTPNTLYAITHTPPESASGLITFIVKNLQPGVYYPTYQINNVDGVAGTHHHATACTVT